MCTVTFGLGWKMMALVMVHNPRSTFVVTVCLLPGNTSASQNYVSDKKHNLSAKWTRLIVAYRSKSLQR